MYDVENVFLALVQNPSSNAVALFWKSYQVQRYIADICYRLGLSATAEESKVNPTHETEEALSFIFEQLAAFARTNELSGGGQRSRDLTDAEQRHPLSVPEPGGMGRRKRGPKPDFERATKMTK